jgi:hypothetical protein
MVSAFLGTGLINDVVTGLTNMTGSLFLTLMMILIILIVIALAMNIPVTIIAIIYMPIVITMATYVGDFRAMFGCILILAGFIIAEKLFPQG